MSIIFPDLLAADCHGSAPLANPHIRFFLTRFAQARHANARWDCVGGRFGGKRRGRVAAAGAARAFADIPVTYGMPNLGAAD